MPVKKYYYNTQYVSKRPTRFLNKKDKRYKGYVAFKERHGFSPDECWNLDDTMAEFLLPRLRYFRNHTIGYPRLIKSFEQWTAILDKIIWSFEQRLKHGWLPKDEYLQEIGLSRDVYEKRYRQGLKLFGKWWEALWW